MSYCRMSDDNGMSDIYCFSNGVVYETHVATFTNSRDRRPIGLPHDGECFIDATPQACKARLLMLRAVGYHVPEDALAGLDEEIAAN